MIPSSRRFLLLTAGAGVLAIMFCATVFMVALLPSGERSSLPLLAATPPRTAELRAAIAGEEGQSPVISERVDTAWLLSVSTSTSIPIRALAAYAGASLTVTQTGQCVIPWTSLATLGGLASQHGASGTGEISDEGNTVPAILGPQTGTGDTDQGAWDGDSNIDLLLGPMRLSPAVLERWGIDGNGDGTVDPQQIDDAALTAARYLCRVEDALTLDEPGVGYDPELMSLAVFREEFAEDSADLEARFGADASATSPSK